MWRKYQIERHTRLEEKEGIPCALMGKINKKR